MVELCILRTGIHPDTGSIRVSLDSRVYFLDRLGLMALYYFKTHFWIT